MFLDEVEAAVRSNARSRNDSQDVYTALEPHGMGGGNSFHSSLPGVFVAFSLEEIA